MRDDEDNPRPGLAERDDVRMRREQSRTLHGGLAAERAESAMDELRRLIERAWRKHGNGDFQEAIDLAGAALDIDASAVAAWQCKVRSLARLHNLDLAISELRRAQRLVSDPAGRAEIDRMLEQYLGERTGAQIERARLALRRAQPAAAVKQLRDCASALGEDTEFQARLTYAQERTAALAARRRADEFTSLAHAALQSVLAWLCADELRRAEQEIEAEQFQKAADYYDTALKLDRRFTRAALSQARALRDHSRAQPRPDSTAGLAKSWSASAKSLAVAERLADQAAGDRALADDAASLLESIREDRRRAIKIAGLCDCSARLDDLFEYYGRARGYTRFEYTNFLSSFATIAGQVDRMIRRYGRSDPDIGVSLGRLEDFIAKIRAEIR
jgi:hypothetical protein